MPEKTKFNLINLKIMDLKITETEESCKGKHTLKCKAGKLNIIAG